jgi:hypothetical protein
MAFTKTTLGTYFGSIIVSDTAAGAVGQDNVTGAASTIHSIEVDNTANSSTTVYFKVYDAANPTIGTDAPDYTFPVPGGTKLAFTTGDGLVFSTAVSYACVTGKDVANTSAPASSVPILIIAV